MKDLFENLDFSLIGELLKYQKDSPMIFSSGLFFILFIFFLFFYKLLHRHQMGRIIYVLLFSLFFYYKSSGWYVVLLIFSATSDFFLAQRMSLEVNQKKKKIFVWSSVIINLTILSFFKYFKFLGDLIWQFFSLLGWSEVQPQGWEDINILLPVGISFYTFQTMSYIIDVYRGDIQPIKKWINYLFYVSFFPQLVAGPIVRAKDFIPQIYKQPFLTQKAFDKGLFLVMIGLVKKTIISDYISLNFVDRVFDAPLLYTGLENLMALYGYALQIYCDFSGYSDMAIGIALFLGFEFNKNFDRPYNSRNITEFWRRWHISLSTWLKDYLYIPLGGNRKGKWKSYRNLLITMLLGGLWHGAGIRFIIWGGLHGLALAFHKMFLSFFPLSSNRNSTLKNFLRITLTFHFVLFTWLFFRCASMEEVGQMLGQIFSNFHIDKFFEFICNYYIVVLLIVLGYLLHFLPENYLGIIEDRLRCLPLYKKVLIFSLFLFIIIQFRSAEIQPFIYFQF